MSEFTYETSDTSRNLETFEWDNVWWEQTANETSKRILYIGDSISCGTRHCITALSSSEIVCDGFGTSKGIDNPFFIPSLELFMKQQSKCDVILFNNGLHGWHLSDEEYENGYRDMLEFLAAKGKPVYALLTTMLPAEIKRDGIVCERNKIASSVADKLGIPVIDLYSVTKEHTEYYSADNVHLVEDGYKLLARRILDAIE